MYRTCPKCKRHIFMDVVQSHLDAENSEDELPFEKTFDLECPYCHKGIRFVITVMTEKDYKIKEASKQQSIASAINEFYASHPDLALEFLQGRQPEKTAELDYDTPDSINFAEVSICFTGKFANPQMTRQDLSNASRFLGATVLADTNRSLDILVVGSVPSPGWRCGNYGGKIERAILSRAETGVPLIISEEHFLKLFKAAAENYISNSKNEASH